jgi:hypothetical protein
MPTTSATKGTTAGGGYWLRIRFVGDLTGKVGYVANDTGRKTLHAVCH